MLSPSRFVRMLTRYVACFQCPRSEEPTIGLYIIKLLLLGRVRKRVSLLYQTFELSGQLKRH